MAAQDGTSRARPNRHQVAYVGTYPPQECGIATFTLDLVNSTDISGWCSVVGSPGDVYPLLPEEIEAPPDPDGENPDVDVKQVYTIKRENRGDYARCAHFLG